MEALLGDPVSVFRSWLSRQSRLLPWERDSRSHPPQGRSQGVGPLFL